MTAQFVPEDFVVPTGLTAPGFRLEPLGADHNERDYGAWMSSIDHIHATPGFESSQWPERMSLEDNLADLVGHAVDFENRRGFTYSVLDGEEDVIGCVYIYPSDAAGHDADVRSWVRASRAEMDVTLWKAVSGWLATDWPFTNVRYAARS